MLIYSLRTELFLVKLYEWKDYILKKFRIVLLGSFALILVLISSLYFAFQERLPDKVEGEILSFSDNQYETLCVPTQFTKVGDDYFIVDCYHNQILTSKDKSLPVKEWKVFTNRINMGHSIASDGYVYLADDTENNQLLVFAKVGEEFYLTQIIENVGKRPHYVIYNEDEGEFYVLSSLTGEFYLYKREKNSYYVFLDRSVQIPQLDEVYVRSFSFIDGDIYLAAGNGFIYDIDQKDFSIKNFWNLSFEIGGPVQISRIGSYYYLTVSTDIIGDSKAATIVRAKELSSFGDGTYEVIRDRFCEDGTPYIITNVDGIYYLCIHSENGANCLWSFGSAKGELLDISRVFQ